MLCGDKCGERLCIRTNSTTGPTNILTSLLFNVLSIGTPPLILAVVVIENLLVDRCVLYAKIVLY